MKYALNDLLLSPLVASGASKLEKNEYYNGVITRCEVAGKRQAGRMIITQFKVWIGLLPLVIVERLPYPK